MLFVFIPFIHNFFVKFNYFIRIETINVRRFCIVEKGRLYKSISIYLLFGN